MGKRGRMGSIHRVMAALVCAAAGGAVTGCASSAVPATQPMQAAPVVQAAPVSPSILQMPKPKAPVLVELDVYQISVPFGAVSANTAFWKRVDETSVDVATYDVLYKNGIRVGEAPVAEWDFFRELIEENPAASKKQTFRALKEMKAATMEMKAGVEGQHIFYYDTQNNLVGRSYEYCNNLISVSFMPAPRKEGAIRVAMCPVVQSARLEYLYSAGEDGEPDVEFARPERIYDLNLKADLRPGHFLIVAPSPEGKWPTSIGKAFMTTDGEAERFENVLLLVHRNHALGATPMTASAISR